MANSLKAQAVKALRDGNHAEAWKNYESILQECRAKGIPASEDVYLNGGACLRRLGRQTDARSILEDGIKYYPFSEGMHKNLANNIVDLKGEQWHSLFHYLFALRLGKAEDRGLLLSSVASLHQLGFPLVAYDLLFKWWQNAKEKKVGEAPQRELIHALLELTLTLFEGEELESIADWCLSRVQHDLPENNIPEQLAMASFCIRRGEIQHGLSHYHIVESAISSGHFKDSQLFINASWNLACTLLNEGEMAIGWRLYEFGLRTPANGPQRWQRALTKVFGAKDVPLWRGEIPPKDTRLLLLAEQAIGDTMMFLQLLPELLKSKFVVTLVLQSRLLPVYQRTYPDLRVVSTENAEDTLLADEFDLQLPVGSLPQYMLEGWVNSGSKNTLLSVDKRAKARLRRQYRKSLSRSTPVIGISWSGGAKRERQRVKSLKPDEMLELLKSIDARFVCLQYGNVAKQVLKWRDDGIDILLSEEVNALENMDLWLAQVAACDLVISVANTTIHGAGLVGVPTLCLLSRSSDWRWVEKMEGSYWYDCVETAKQEKNGSWHAALQEAREWVNRKMSKQKVDPLLNAKQRSSMLSFNTYEE
jgi:tetratricopeptide (TPR) repeat protein